MKDYPLFEYSNLITLKHVTLKEAIYLLHRHRRCEHTFFTVFFEKRTDGTPREMKCRFHVTKYLAGGEQAYRPTDYNLMCVFDTEKLNYRSINLETLMWMKLSSRLENGEFETINYIVDCNKSLQEKHKPEGFENYKRER